MMRWFSAVADQLSHSDHGCRGSADFMRTAAMVLGCFALATIGCAPASVDRTYGKRRGSGGQSVNGTAVLAGMFEQAGFRVSTWRRLSPKLDEADVIVWVPDDFDAPALEQRTFLEEWLDDEDGRTLVYVGRDFDAAIGYWQMIRASVPPAQALEVARRLAHAQSEMAAARTALPPRAEMDWFVMRGAAASAPARSLEGPWSEGIDAARTDIELASRLDVPGEAETAAWLEREENVWEGPAEFEVLLSTQGRPLVTRLSLGDWSGSKLQIVANGSFLLNLPLVNHEHRKLATRLVSACGPAGRVVFLESGPGGPLVLDSDPDANYPTGLEMFTVWPLGMVVFHLAVLGITLAVICFPVFGRPRHLEVASESDFGQHVTAVGELLEKTGDTGYALARLRYYHDHVRPAGQRGDRPAASGSIRRTRES